MWQASGYPSRDGKTITAPQAQASSVATRVPHQEGAALGPSQDTFQHAELGLIPGSLSGLEMQNIRAQSARAHQSAGRNAKPFSQELRHYKEYRSLIERYCREQSRSPIAELNDFLKNNKEASALRQCARLELQNMYDAVADQLNMPRAQVYLPTRKKISTHGLAVAKSNEIRIYAIHGPTKKEYGQWTVGDISLDPIEEVCETLVHESAHIHQWHVAQVMDHEETFIKGYEKCEEAFVRLGFGPLLLPAYRFSGVPRSSKAATLTGQARPHRGDCMPPVG